MRRLCAGEALGVCPTKIQTGKLYENKLSTFFRLNLRLAELIIPKLIQIKYGNGLDRMRNKW